MRALLFLLAFLLAGPLTYAQRPSSPTTQAVVPGADATVSRWHQHQDSVFQHIDRTPVSSGLLIDYGFSFVNPANYQGTLLDSNCVDLGTWRLVYGGLHDGAAHLTGYPLDARRA